jgi:hypothetical protein
VVIPVCVALAFLITREHTTENPLHY